MPKTAQEYPSLLNKIQQADLLPLASLFFGCALTIPVLINKPTRRTLAHKLIIARVSQTFSRLLTMPAALSRVQNWGQLRSRWNLGNGSAAKWRLEISVDFPSWNDRICRDNMGFHWRQHAVYGDDSSLWNYWAISVWQNLIVILITKMNLESAACPKDICMIAWLIVRPFFLYAWLFKIT